MQLVGLKYFLSLCSGLCFNVTGLYVSLKSN